MDYGKVLYETTIDSLYKAEGIKTVTSESCEAKYMITNREQPGFEWHGIGFIFTKYVHHTDEYVGCYIRSSMSYPRQLEGIGYL